VKIVVLQHPSETTHAKNTARLVALAIPAAEIVVGETAEDFSELQVKLVGQQSAAVFYPAVTSVEFDQNAAPQAIDTMLFIDGTWRKALKIWQLNPWLWTMPAFSLKPTYPSNYAIRKTKQPNSLSTLEAVSLALTLYNGTNTAPLLDLQQAMQKHWLSNGHRSKKPSNQS
jgi:DTW domain-containing protein YfiP